MATMPPKYAYTLLLQQEGDLSSDIPSRADGLTKRAANETERTIGVGPDELDGRQADYDYQGQHHRIFDCRWTIFLFQQLDEHFLSLS
jgi:hypothetical protein